MATGTELRQMDPSIWRACAGTSVQIPTVDSRVYYFPQGHAEQSSSPPLFSPLVSSQPMILCRVAAVRHLANPETDEVVAKIRLVPVVDRSRDFHLLGSGGKRDGGGGEEEEVVSFAKILTPSDANNGGGFSVPRFCADSIFPPLDFQADPPVQTITIRDVQGAVWEFRHIYRGTPRRHLLTTGWSKFVNNKKLVAGDSVVFMRNRRSSEHFVGIRRAVKPNAESGGRWNFPVGSVRVRVEENGGNSGGGGGEDGFSRSFRGKDSAEAVAEAAELAAQGREFEIVYYPRVGCADFVVKAEIVKESLTVFWTAGMRIKMAMETVDSSRMTWFQGTVSTAMVPDNGPWRGSPWRMLQITWDEPEVLQNGKRVNPWLVEYVVPTPPLHSPFPPAKRLRVPQDPVLLTDGQELLFPMREFSNSMMGNFNPSLMNYSSFPAGMQGARQDPFCVSALSNFLSEGGHQTCIDNFFYNDKTPKKKTVSTDLYIGSLRSGSFSPDSQSSVHISDIDLAGRQGCNSTKNAGSNSIQLFGKIIHMKEPVEETEGVNNLVDLSLPYRKLYDGRDNQCQRGSAFEACLL